MYRYTERMVTATIFSIHDKLHDIKFVGKTLGFMEDVIAQLRRRESRIGKFLKAASEENYEIQILEELTDSVKTEVMEKAEQRYIYWLRELKTDEQDGYNNYFYEDKAHWGTVYLITNKANGLQYVGETKHPLSTRLKFHVNNAHAPSRTQMIGAAIDTEGIENFSVKALEICKADTTQQLTEVLFEREMHWVKTLDTKNNGYNRTDGGRGSYGRAVSDETKKKISAANSGERNGMYGTTWSEEKRESMKLRMSGENNHNYGKPLSDETKQKLSQALKGRVISEETRKRTSAAMKGIPKTEETRKRMSEAQKGKKISEQTKEKIKATRRFGDDNALSKAVCQLTLTGDLVARHGSMSDAARAVGSYHSIISDICHHKRNKKVAAGFTFCFEYELEATINSINLSTSTVI